MRNFEKLADEVNATLNVHGFSGAIYFICLPPEMLAHPDIVAANGIMREALNRANDKIRPAMLSKYPMWSEEPIADIRTGPEPQA